VSQAREKEGELLDSHYRRDFISCDNQLLNGEMFLQVKYSTLSKSIFIFARLELQYCR
jgi:hypothetical protein